MLEFIKKYRNNPERTVLTVKCKRSFYILKRKDIVNRDCAPDDADVLKNNVCNDKNKSNASDGRGSDKCLRALLTHLGSCCAKYVLEGENAVLSGNKNIDDVTVAFKSNESCIDTDNFCNGEILESDRRSESKLCAENTMILKREAAQRLKTNGKHTTDALVCEKTKRVLLCDLFACLILVFTVVMAACKLAFRQK